MGVYLVIGNETFKVDRTSKEVMLRLARNRVMSKTAISRDENLSQHVYINPIDIEVVVKPMVCSVFGRSIPVTRLAYLMDQIEELWELAVKRTSLFTDPANAYLLTMLCELTGTQSAERITSMVYNFKLIRFLYGQLGFNLGPMDKLPQFCSTDGAHILPSHTDKTFYTNMAAS
jgi:hypothetical protein